MSAESFIAYFGLRFALTPEEIEGVELRIDPRIVAARKVGLRYYWGNFGETGEKYLLFIGHQIGIFGAENSAELNLSLSDSLAAFENAKQKIAAAGFGQTAELHLIWEPDH